MVKKEDAIQEYKNEAVSLYPSENEYKIMQSQAKALVESGLLPKGIDTPEKALIVAETGRELKMPFMASMNNIYPINGRTSLGVHLMGAICRKECPNMTIEVIFYPEGSWDFKRLKDELKLTYTDIYCKVILTRPPNKPYTSEYYLSDAKQAGLFDKSGSNWPKIPKNMCESRALTHAYRAVFPDVLIGMLSHDEAREIEPDEIVKTYSKTIDVVPEEQEQGTYVEAEVKIPMLPKGGIVSEKTIRALKGMDISEFKEEKFPRIKEDSPNVVFDDSEEARPKEVEVKKPSLGGFKLLGKIANTEKEEKIVETKVPETVKEVKQEEETKKVNVSSILNQTKKPKKLSLKLPKKAPILEKEGVISDETAILIGAKPFSPNQNVENSIKTVITAANKSTEKPKEEKTEIDIFQANNVQVDPIIIKGLDHFGSLKSKADEQNDFALFRMRYIAYQEFPIKLAIDTIEKEELEGYFNKQMSNKKRNECLVEIYEKAIDDLFTHQLREEHTADKLIEKWAADMIESVSEVVKSLIFLFHGKGLIDRDHIFDELKKIIPLKDGYVQWYFEYFLERKILVLEKNEIRLGDVIKL